jgi:hypothetical protein
VVPLGAALLLDRSARLGVQLTPDEKHAEVASARESFGDCVSETNLKDYD